MAIILTILLSVSVKFQAILWPTTCYVVFSQVISILEIIRHGSEVPVTVQIQVGVFVVTNTAMAMWVRLFMLCSNNAAVFAIL